MRACGASPDLQRSRCAITQVCPQCLRPAASKNSSRPGFRPASWFPPSQTAAELRGTPCIPLELAPPTRKGLVVSRAVGQKLTAIEPIKEAVAAYLSRAAKKSRGDKLLAGHMPVFLHNSRFAAAEPCAGGAVGVRLPHAASDTAELIRRAVAALGRAYRPAPRTPSAASCRPISAWRTPARPISSNAACTLRPVVARMDYSQSADRVPSAKLRHRSKQIRPSVLSTYFDFFTEFRYSKGRRD